MSIHTTKSHKSFVAKLKKNGDLPKVEITLARTGQVEKHYRLAIASPMMVAQLVAQVPVGKVCTVNHLRAAIAQQMEADLGCPMTTGIFLQLAAGASAELAGGAMELLHTHVPYPFWRVLREGWLLNPKYPGGIELQEALLAQEGHTFSWNKTQTQRRVLVLDSMVWHSFAPVSGQAE